MAKATRNYLALDLGAESGRGIVGRFDGKTIALEEVHRFGHVPLRYNGALRWDVLLMSQHLKQALAAATTNTRGSLISLGVDTWGVDYVLLDKHDHLLGYPWHYRDERNYAAMNKLLKKISREELHRVTGLQFMQFNTIFQLYAEQLAATGVLDVARTLLFMPDFLAFSLGGEKACEYTIASTSQLVDARKRTWSKALLEKAGLPRRIFKPLTQPGTVLGPLRTEVAEETGAPGSINVVTVGAHDTASAVAAVPVQAGAGDDWAYLSSGTWSLFGAEVREPELGLNTLEHSFTNEGGLNGTIRLLTNIMGLWLVQELRRAWTDKQGHAPDYATLTQQAAEAPGAALGGAIVLPNWGPFGRPTKMPEKFTAFCKATGQKPPKTQGEFVRCALESLALAYRDAKLRLEAIRGTQINRLHIVGGGTKNKLLNQLAANACGVEVLAGPEEATALGNILAQLLADGAIKSLEEGRAIIKASFKPERYLPQYTATWDALYERYAALQAKKIPEAF